MRDLCRFEGVYGALPESCHRGVSYEVNRLIYWSDNNRSGYKLADLPPTM
ncbi:hypothetical protein GTP45_09970 [Pseudoduganella sp. FT55W]|uniref:Uncharacterized protein n=1 Tax=Duganella rivi TaxID=2666083 RepID=A0A7X4GQB4_9BURK|nr:hypothetical protein [Duganella rivi]MYM67156.1 hypothetical protein [Duganella rivi]